MGKECLQIFLNLNFSAKDVAITSVLHVLKDYFIPMRNNVYERYVFNYCVQMLEETVACYVNRVRKFASSCQ